eukprot:366137-Chlamydomonas_euryale.AAC.5
MLQHKAKRLCDDATIAMTRPWSSCGDQLRQLPHWSVETGSALERPRGCAPEKVDPVIRMWRPRCCCTTLCAWSWRPTGEPAEGGGSGVELPAGPPHDAAISTPRLMLRTAMPRLLPRTASPLRHAALHAEASPRSQPPRPPLAGSPTALGAARHGRRRPRGRCQAAAPGTLSAQTHPAAAASATAAAAARAVAHGCGRCPTVSTVALGGCGSGGVLECGGTSSGARLRSLPSESFACSGSRHAASAGASGSGGDASAVGRSGASSCCGTSSGARLCALPVEVFAVSGSANSASASAPGG